MRGTLKYLFPAVLAVCMSAGMADMPVLKGFRYPEHDQHGRLKMEVIGDEAQFQPDGRIRISNLRMVFYEEGKAVTEVTAPECLFDRENRTATSTSSVVIARAEIRLSGEGFRWQAEDGSFEIKNNTRVVLKKLEE